MAAWVLPAAFVTPILLVLSATVLAQDTGSFGKFLVEPLNPPKGARTIDDPTGTAPTPRIYSFMIPKGYCKSTPYETGSPESDCTNKSVRSQLFQKPSAGQPKEAWYGWYMYFPKDFAYGPSQPSGFYSFAYWHNKKCPHLVFGHQPGGFSSELRLQAMERDRNGDCLPKQKVALANFSVLLERWVRFEVFVRWAKDDTGEVIVFLDGKETARISGANLVKGLEKTNYFKFGLYLCCTRDIEKIVPTAVMFAGVKRAKTRKELEAR